MSEALSFNLEDRPAPGVVEEIAPGVRRIVADNPGPHTFTGTNSYIVGEGTVAVIDPGPDDEAHLDRLIAALEGRTVSHVLVTHTHRDHSPLARALGRRTGAEVLGFAVPEPASSDCTGGIEASGDTGFSPHRTVGDGDRIEGPGWALEALHTPGHAGNHLCFALAGTGILFSGDHVMGWSTTMVAPPDGDMAAYFNSLGRLEERDDQAYLPGHGGRIIAPGDYVRALTRHRKDREASILGALSERPGSAVDIAHSVYRGLTPRLMRSATMTTLAHLIHLAKQGKATASGAVTIDTMFRAKA